MRLHELDEECDTCRTVTSGLSELNRQSEALLRQEDAVRKAVSEGRSLSAYAVFLLRFVYSGMSYASMTIRLKELTQAIEKRSWRPGASGYWMHRR